MKWILILFIVKEGASGAALYHTAYPTEASCEAHLETMQSFRAGDDDTVLWLAYCAPEPGPMRSK